jgi:hypothetical protein
VCRRTSMAYRRKTCREFPWPTMRRYATPLNPAGGESALLRGHKAILDLFTSILPAIWRQLVGQFGREISR